MATRTEKGVAVKAKAIPKPSDVYKPSEKLLARLCYLYPQYTFNSARKLSFRRVKLLIETAHRIEAERMLNLTQIAAAPHTKKMVGVKKLTTHFKRLVG